LGLFGMQERADMLGGQLLVSTKHKEGTSISLVVSLADNNEKAPPFRAGLNGN